MPPRLKPLEHLQTTVRPKTALPGIGRALQERKRTEVVAATRKEEERKGFDKSGMISDAGSDYSAYRSDEFTGEGDTVRGETVLFHFEKNGSCPVPSRSYESTQQNRVREFMLILL